MSAVHTPMPSDLLVHGWQDPGAVCGHAAPEASTGGAPEVADIFRTYGEAYRATHRLYGLLFQSASATLQTFGRDPRWLGGEIGLTLVLHTWGQTLEHHVHVHGIVTGGALAPDGARWIATKRRDFLFPVRGLAKVLRGKYLAGLQRAYAQGALHLAGSTASLADPKAFDRFMAQLRQHAWVVYAKPPFASAAQVVSSLGRSTHRVAISNHRLVAVHEGQVAFRWRDYHHGNRVKVMRLAAGEFIRRFLLLSAEAK